MSILTVLEETVAVVEKQAHTLRLTRMFDAPRETVFDAFTNPDILKHWWGPKGWATSIVEMDVKIGGMFRFGMRREGEAEITYVKGVYREIVSPAKLSYTYIYELTGAGKQWNDAGFPNHETLVTIELVERGDSTEMVFVHERFPSVEFRNMHENGWGSGFDCLEQYLSNTTL